MNILHWRLYTILVLSDLKQKETFHQWVASLFGHTLHSSLIYKKTDVV